MDTKKKVNIGLVGVGVISHYYLSAMSHSSDVVLRAACDVNPEKLTSIAASGIPTTTQLAALISHPDIEAIIVNAPNDCHYHICAAVLEAGKHLCCEKPLTLRLSQANDLAAQASLSHLTLFTAFHRRYNRNILSLLRREQLGTPMRSVHVRYYEHIQEHCGDDSWYLNPQRCGGGVIADNGPNAFDIVRLFLGEIEVSKALVERSNNGTDIRAHIDVVSKNSNAVGTILLDWEYPKGELKDVTIVSSDGSIDGANMLDGFSEFKSSLYHEYDGVIADFVSCIGNHMVANPREIGGIEISRLIADSYQLAQSVDNLQLD